MRRWRCWRWRWWAPRPRPVVMRADLLHALIRIRDRDDAAATAAAVRYVRRHQAAQAAQERAKAAGGDVRPIEPGNRPPGAYSR